MQLTKSMAEKMISDLGMNDMPLVEYRPGPACIAADWFPKYKELTRDFLKSLTDSIESLAFLNLSQDSFMNIITGRGLAENLSLRLRVPLTMGGQLEISNMFMCRTFPHSHNMDRFIINQSGAETIWLPDPVKKIYVPAHTANGGDGGNATEDRLTQMAAQIASDRGME